MADDFTSSRLQPRPDADETGISGWLRWWHSLILIALFLFGIVYFPLWRFDRRWKQIQVGDSFDRVKSLLGDPGEADYTALGVGPQGSYQAFGYRVYWRSYEVQIATDSNRVLGKSVTGPATLQGTANQPPTSTVAPKTTPKR